MTDAQTLLKQANCLSCYGSNPGMMDLLEVALLAQIALTAKPPVTAPVLTAALGGQIAWVWSATNPVTWLILPTGDSNPADAIDNVPGTARMDSPGADPGTSVYIRGVGMDGITFTTPPSNSVVTT